MQVFVKQHIALSEQQLFGCERPYLRTRHSASNPSNNSTLNQHIVSVVSCLYRWRNIIELCLCYTLSPISIPPQVSHRHICDYRSPTEGLRCATPHAPVLDTYEPRSSRRAHGSQSRFY